MKAVSGKEFTKILEKKGWVLVKEKGVDFNEWQYE